MFAYYSKLFQCCVFEVHVKRFFIINRTLSISYNNAFVISYIAINFQNDLSCLKSAYTLM